MYLRGDEDAIDDNTARLDQGDSGVHSQPARDEDGALIPHALYL